LELDSQDRHTLASLFEEYHWNYLAASILEGQMGRALADDPENPSVAVLEATSLELSILGGDSRHPEAERFLRGLAAAATLICSNTEWEQAVRRIHRGRLVFVPRYAFTSESLSVKKLESLRDQVPPEFDVESMDLTLARRLASEDSSFAADHMLNFESPDDFVDRGFGFCALHGESIVCAATTFAVCASGLEIQINTRDAYRRRGLATAVAARLLLHSKSLGLDPNWDAGSLSSVGLAEKLGYTPQDQYTMFVYAGSRFLSAFARFGLWMKRRRGG
jgi:hypothetical protein